MWWDRQDALAPEAAERLLASLWDAVLNTTRWSHSHWSCKTGETAQFRCQKYQYYEATERCSNNAAWPTATSDMCWHGSASNHSHCYIQTLLQYWDPVFPCYAQCALLVDSEEEELLRNEQETDVPCLETQILIKVRVNEEHLGMVHKGPLLHYNGVDVW